MSVEDFENTSSIPIDVVPNPTNYKLNVNLELDKRSKIQVEIYSLQGRSMDKMFMVYPNPSQNELNIRFNDALEGDLEIKLFDAIGEVVIIKRINNPQQESEFQLSIKNISAGIYLLQINNENQQYTHKVILSK